MCFWYWYTFLYWYTFWYLDTFWYCNLSWDLDWNISASTFNFNSACWWPYSNWGWSYDWTYSNWGWSYYWSGTKTRQKKRFSISCFGISLSFRFWVRFTLGNNVSG